MSQLIEDKKFIYSLEQQLEEVKGRYKELAEKLGVTKEDEKSLF